MATESGQSAIETIFLEERRYPPPEEFAKQANAKPEIYDESFDAFWEREGRERLSWFEPFGELYEWEPPYAKFYPRRQAERLLQLRRPPRRRGRGRQGRVLLGGRAGGRPRGRSRTPISSGTSSGSPTR